MVHLSTGDQSGRPDTSGVDQASAEVYAGRMFDAVVFARFGECQRIHQELNDDPALYTLAIDKFKALCKQRGVSRGGELWREYSHDS